MSASLVGSEMCIRDREGGRARMGSNLGVPQGPEQATLSVRAIAFEAPQPVSYTHLTLPTICSV
eukprot:3123846-Alexandrium_andersonii.AAC.1